MRSFARFLFVWLILAGAGARLFAESGQSDSPPRLISQSADQDHTAAISDEGQQAAFLRHEDTSPPCPLGALAKEATHSCGPGGPSAVAW